ncbi:hypothetical protein KL914_002297 [Ogataea haglerorum]|nr:hypothetical protein KL914_002297 [Ogataea haglerorum]
MKSSCFLISLFFASLFYKTLAEEAIFQRDDNCVVNFHTVVKYEFVYASGEKSDSSTKSRPDSTSSSKNFADPHNTHISQVLSSSSDMSPTITPLIETSTNGLGPSSSDPETLKSSSTFSTLSESSRATFDISAESNSVIISSSSTETAAVTNSYVSSSTAIATPSSSSSSSVLTSSSTSSTSSTSSSVSTSSLSSFAQTYLNRHNHFRALHEDTPNLTWNEDVAEVAQKYADAYTCNGELVHSGNSLDGQSLGENLAYGYNFATAGAVDAWYSEINQYSYADPGYSEATGHFTQLNWKSSTDVGCAYKYCGSYLGYYIVCNYLPTGNLVLSGDPSYFFKQNVMPLKS